MHSRVETSVTYQMFWTNWQDPPKNTPLYCIKSMLFAARRNPCVSEIVFNGVSIPPGTNESEAKKLDDLNHFMEAELGSEFYLAPLDRNEVHIEPNNSWHIHYDQTIYREIWLNSLQVRIFNPAKRNKRSKT